MLVTRIDNVILTESDSPNLELDPVVNNPIRGPLKNPPAVEGFKQSWNGKQPEEHITVKYWLFALIDDAQKAADEWRYVISNETVQVNGKWESVYQPETGSSVIIGDKTWRAGNSIWFVKNNVLVYVMGRRPLMNQLPFTRAVARKIEAKIDAELSKP